jgi:alpha-ketoglutarate-dependent taurine dioxygenase
MINSVGIPTSLRPVSRRGVVFFRAQDDLTNDLQKQLVLRLGEVTGKHPSTSGLHIHPILNAGRELGGSDNEISTISSVQHKNLNKPKDPGLLSPVEQYTARWHSDIPFEPVPAAYTLLRLTELPRIGGGR